MDSALGKLVNFTNKHKLELIGLLFQPQDIVTDTIIIHIHGNYGNFYNNKFLWYMSKTYIQNGASFLTFNLSAHDGLSEGYRTGELDYIGGGVADYNESISDIEAAIDYVHSLGYSNIFLQGHSLGCDKILEYIIEHKPNEISVILLSPVDSYAVQKRWLSIHKNETVEEQINRLKTMKSTRNNGLEWLNIDEYGSEGLNNDWIYQIPVTRKTLLSILEGSAFKYLNLECGANFTLSNNTFVFLGRRDSLQMTSQREMRIFLERCIPNCYIEDTLDSDHDIIGVEQVLADSIVNWMRLIGRYAKQRSLDCFDKCLVK